MRQSNSRNRFAILAAIALTVVTACAQADDDTAAESEQAPDEATAESGEADGARTEQTGDGLALNVEAESLALTCVIALTGEDPTATIGENDEDAFSEPRQFLGEVRWVAYAFLSYVNRSGGWSECDGSHLSIAENQELYALLGETYGPATDTTFALPDARGRTPVGAGAGPGLTDRPLGSTWGAEEVQLDLSMFPDHHHGDNTGFAGGGDTGIPISQPSIAFHCLIDAGGVFPPRAFRPRLQTNLAEIKLVAFDTIPDTWFRCDGQTLPIVEHQSLYSLLGTNYGGNGVDEFSLPDVRGRTLIGAGYEDFSDWRDVALGDTAGQETLSVPGRSLDGHQHQLPSGESTPEGGGEAIVDLQQPNIKLVCVVATAGRYPSRDDSETWGPMIGEIAWFAGSFAPRGWAFCDGSLLPIQPNAALFSLIGTQFGGNVPTDFALPDLRNRVIVGSGASDGLTARNVADQFGLSVVELTDAVLPAHTHGFLEPGAG